MDSLRNIIDNLYIYKNHQNLGQKSMTINDDNFNNEIADNIQGTPFKNDDLSNISQINFQEDDNSFNKINANINEIKVNVKTRTKKRYESPTENELVRNKITKEKLRNLSSVKIQMPKNYESHFIIKQGINYIEKNKENLREKELQMKEEKLRKENAALKLLLNRKKNFYSYIPSKVYDIKPPEVPLRNKSSQINRIKIKPKNEVKKSNEVVLPIINSQNDILKKLENGAVLHKDFGKTPQYLEKMKEEYKNQKEEEKRKEKEKKLPRGVRYMDENDRIARIDELESMKKDLEYELFKMPLTRLTYKMNIRKGELEKQLNDIETELNKLSYKDVIIGDTI